MTGLQFLPTEGIILIFESCDSLSQAIALALTSKWLYAIFLDLVHSIGTHIGRREILAFDDAMIAARATRLVLEHFHDGHFPPDPFPLETLGFKAQKLSLKDMGLALDWAHLVNCIEDTYLVNTKWGAHVCLLFGELDSPTAHDWRERSHRSMYRVFLAGAVLCRTYQEPLFLEAPYGFFDQSGGNRPLEEDGIQQMLKYPVFNFESYEDHGPVYSQLADYFVQQSQDRAQRESPPAVYPEEAIPYNLSRDHANTLYADVLQCVFAYMLLSDTWNEIVLFQQKEEFTDGGAAKWPRKVTVLLLENFYPEEVSMPADAKASRDTVLLKTILDPNTPNVLYFPFLELNLSGLYSYSGQPNHYGQDMPTPRPPLQIFQFIFRKYLGLRFSDVAFSQEFSTTIPYRLFLCGEDSGQIYFEGKAAFWPDGAMDILDIPDGNGDYEPYFLP
ncbi:hypothetical protein BJX96DRAFT_170395 [Aspergillus floccosus]